MAGACILGSRGEWLEKTINVSREQPECSTITWEYEFMLCTVDDRKPLVAFK